MKALILHGLNGSPNENWFPWLKAQLRKLNFEVWVPKLPSADMPDTKKWTEFLMSSNWDFQDNLLVGHSAGAVEILALLESLAEDISVNTAIMVALFQGSLGWDNLSKLDNLNFDFGKIRQKAKHLIVLNSDDDPYIPIDNVEPIATKLDANLKIFHGKGHFSKEMDPRFDKFPELLDIIKGEMHIND